MCDPSSKAERGADVWIGHRIHVATKHEVVSRMDDWGKLLGDTATVTALFDRLLHHAHVLKCGLRSWRTKAHTDLRTEEGAR